MDKSSVLSNVAEVKLRYSTKVKASDRAQIKCSDDAERLIREFWDDDMEHVESAKLILLNRANKVLGIANISMGGTTGTVVDSKLIFQYALKTNASGLILVHNHPSGNFRPSPADENITRRVKEAGQLFNIQLLDHLIITPHDGCFSFTDEGLL